jgi:hypothetical protein
MQLFYTYKIKQAYIKLYNAAYAYNNFNKYK